MGTKSTSAAHFSGYLVQNCRPDGARAETAITPTGVRAQSVDQRRLHTSAWALVDASAGALRFLGKAQIVSAVKIE